MSTIPSSLQNITNQVYRILVTRFNKQQLSMGGALSKKSAPKKPEITGIDRAVLDLKNARDRLQKYRTKLENDEARLVQQARIARDAGKKERALGILRLRRYKQSQAAKCEDQLLNVLKMVETIDSKQNESNLLSALAAGKDSLKKMHEETTVDDVLNLMDEIKEEIEVENEITEILSGVPTLSAADEEAVEAELLALELEVNGIPDARIELPNVPSNKLPDIKVPAKQKTPQAEQAREPVLA